MVVTKDAFEQIARADPERTWELHRGELREKPSMSVEHGDVAFHLAMLLQLQLDRREFRLRVNHGHLRISSDTYYVADVTVIPVALDRPQRGRPGTLEVHPEPMPLVIEVWSPSTGRYDVETKLPEYQVRGDLEIWRLHPYERSLTVWRRRSDGSYEQTVYRGGTVAVASLPGVTIDLDALFADMDLASGS